MVQEALGVARQTVHHATEAVAAQVIRDHNEACTRTIDWLQHQMSHRGCQKAGQQSTDVLPHVSPMQPGMRHQLQHTGQHINDKSDRTPLPVRCSARGWK